MSLGKGVKGIKSAEKTLVNLWLAFLRYFHRAQWKRARKAGRKAVRVFPLSIARHFDPRYLFYFLVFSLAHKVYFICSNIRCVLRILYYLVCLCCYLIIRFCSNLLQSQTWTPTLWRCMWLIWVKGSPD